MGFFKKIFKSPIFKVAAPLALSVLAPGIGTAIGSALGATGAGASALGSGIIGAGLGAAGGGGLKGAALGGVTGGIGGYVNASGGLTGVANKAGFGNAAYNALDAADNGGLLSGFGSSVANAGSSLLGAADKATGGLSTTGPSLSNIIGSGSSGGTGNVLGAAANLYSGIQGNDAIKTMARAQQASNDAALAEQARQYDQTTANMSPYLATGTAANKRLSGILGIDGGNIESQMAALQQDPGYQFRLDQGTQAMNRSLGASGNLFSGKALKAAQEFGQGLADQTYNDSVQRLSNASASGQNAAANLGATGANYANSVSNLYGNQGDITAASSMARNNNINQSLANLIGSNVGGFFGGQQSQYRYDPRTGLPLQGGYF